MFNPSRDQAREFFFESWRKFNAREPLTDLEKIAAHVIGLHPEYHPLLAVPDRYRERDYPPELGETNPFLHLGLHLAVEEQLAIDQPHGICGHYAALLARLASEHDARHAILECLAETIWRAQRDGAGLDERFYLDCIAARARQ